MLAPMKRVPIHIVEGICYLHPHKQELSETSLSMTGTWRHCVKILQAHNNAFMAPLLVDDLKRGGTFGEQSVESLLRVSTGKKYSALPWLGKPVMESEIERQYGNLGCKLFDAIYHKNILMARPLLSDDWKWTVVHPSSFKRQQAGMLLDLWNLVSESIDVHSLSNATKQNCIDLRTEMRSTFLSRFEHHWIRQDGTLESVTRPVYAGKRIDHQDIGTQETSKQAQ